MPFNGLCLISVYPILLHVGHNLRAIYLLKVNYYIYLNSHPTFK